MIDVAVAGSLHLDIMVDAPRLPSLDETLMGSSWHYKCGGKGGNQAMAAARFGARTAFGGQIGEDDFGHRLRENLTAAGIDISCLGVDPQIGSGMSVAITESSGEYGAVVVSGANLSIDPQAIAMGWSTLWDCKVLLLQNEVPEAVNLMAAAEARKRGALVLLNAAPARRMADQMLGLVDVLIVNRVEATMLTGKSDAETALRSLHRETRDVVLTLGGDGLLLMTRDGSFTAQSALKVEMLSAHGAGDCFCGALAARLAQGDTLVRASDYARIAAARFVSTPENQQASINDAMVRESM